MTNLLGFINAMTDNLGERPSEMDLAIFARIAYLPFQIVLKDSSDTKPLTLACEEILENLSDHEELLLLPSDKQLMERLAYSKRYANVEITNFVNSTDRSVTKQFSAVTLLLDRSFKVVSFRGTDGTLIGWREDFNLVFQSDVAAQKDALIYLHQALESDNRKLWIVGHSKGGNLAVYATVKENLALLSPRLIQTVNFDGPGFPQDLISKTSDSPYSSLITTLIPQLSVFGMLGKYPFDQRIVLSIGKGLWQHDLYTWQSDKDGRFLGTTGLRDSSHFINQTTSDILESTSVEERQKFIDTIFETFQNMDYVTIKDVMKNWNQVLQMIKTKSGDASPVTKKYINQTISTLMAVIIKNISGLNPHRK